MTNSKLGLKFTNVPYPRFRPNVRGQLASSIYTEILKKAIAAVAKPNPGWKDYLAEYLLKYNVDAREYKPVNYNKVDVPDKTAQKEATYIDKLIAAAMDARGLH